MSAAESERRHEDGEDWGMPWRLMAWYGWASPLGLGLFIVLIALSFGVIHHALGH
jgi:hypothetical protein